MANNCKDCGSQGEYVTYNVPKDCDKLPIKDCKPIDSSCVFYTSSLLSTIGITTPNATAELIFQKIDEFLSGISGANYGSYNTFCLGSTPTQKDFVETISEFVCTLRDDVDNITFSESAITALTNTVNGIISPNLSLCSYIGTTTSSTLNEILEAISDKVCDLHSYASISGVDWDLAYTVISPPTTISAGFDEVIRQINLLKSSVPPAISLPTFNTVFTCLPTKTATTSLSVVVGELIQKACSTATFESSELSWGCLSEPIVPDLTNVVQTLITSISDVKYSSPLFDTDHFALGASSCAGTEVRLSDDVLEMGATVAVDEGGTEGYLKDILEAGSNIGLDTNTPNKIKINSIESGRVKVSSNGALQFLNTAIEGGGMEGISIKVSQNGDKVLVAPEFDFETIADRLLNTISNNPTLMAKLCNMICQCNNC